MKVCTDSCLFGAWVAAKIEKKVFSPETILDIGTGTGLLSMMLAQKASAQIHAVDIDKNSFEQASENFNGSAWNNRLRPFHSDIKEWEAPCTYDLVIANPPFYENDLLPEDSGKSISKHSSTLTLRDLLQATLNLLKKDGNFAVLLPAVEAKWFENTASAYSLFVREKMDVKQTPLHHNFRTMLLFQNQKTTTIKNELTIKNNNNEYTYEFSELLKDYYLYL